MPDPNPDVNSPDPSTEQPQVVNENAETPAAETQPTQEPNETPEQGEAQPLDPNLYDSRGVPWKNVAQEWQRKATENLSEEKLRQIASEEAARINLKNTQPQYTIAQLEQHAIERPDQRPWVEEEKAKIIQDNVAKITEEKVREVEQRSNNKVIEQQSYQWLASNPNYADLFITDSFGRKSFDINHPMTQIMDGYIRDPSLANRPDKLVVAAKLARADYLDMQQPINQKRVKTLQQTLKKVQKQTLVEGGSNVAPQAKSTIAKSKERLMQSGSINDASAVMREILKNSGLMEE